MGTKELIDEFMSMPLHNLEVKIRQKEVKLEKLAKRKEGYKKKLHREYDDVSGEIRTLQHRIEEGKYAKNRVKFWKEFKLNKKDRQEWAEAHEAYLRDRASKSSE